VQFTMRSFYQVAVKVLRRSRYKGQALVEYTLLVMLIALVFWVSVKNANLGTALTDAWNKIAACMGDVPSCSSAS
jgi:Flp pilus assembly pilin Flp